MPTTRKRKAKRRPTPTADHLEREAKRKELRAAIRREKDIWRLSRQLERAIDKSHAVLAELSATIAYRADDAPAAAGESTH